MIELVMYTNNLGVYANAKAIAAAPELFVSHLNVGGLRNTQQVVNLTLNAEAPPVQYPFEFTTPESRAAYFAKYEEILPYQRGGWVRQWEVRIEQQADYVFIVRLENDAEESPFVYGPRQVPGHRITGWPHYQDAIVDNDLSGVAWLEMQDLWIKVTKGAGALGFRSIRQ
jgi:hypothetical protein